MNAHSGGIRSAATPPVPRDPPQFFKAFDRRDPAAETGGCILAQQQSGEPRPSPEPDAYRQQKLVAHFKDGDVARGFSRDFRPDGEVFHLMSWDGEVTSSRKIQVDQLKALFHVKTWGTPGGHKDRRREFPPEPETVEVPREDASRTIVEFYDGEEIWGYAHGYHSPAPGFYLFPADPQDNNRKIFVVRSSLVNIQFLDN